MDPRAMLLLCILFPAAAGGQDASSSTTNAPQAAPSPDPASTDPPSQVASGSPAQPAASKPHAAKQAKTSTPQASSHVSANAAVANLIDAMLAVTQQQPVSAGVSGADAAAAQSKLAQLKSGLTPGADAGETTREAAALLSTLYPSPATSPPPAPSTPPPQAGVGAHLLPLTLTALVLALLSPLLCVLGFLRAAKAARSAIREAFTQAGLL